MNNILSFKWKAMDPVRPTNVKSFKMDRKPFKKLITIMPIIIEIIATKYENKNADLNY